MKKKLVAIISVVAMLVTMFPATVWADQNRLPEPVNGVIKLTDNVTLDGICTVLDDVHKLDLNGYNLNVTRLDVKGNLVITDGSDKGTGKIESTDLHTVVVWSGGKLTLEKGSIVNSMEGDDGTAIFNMSEVNINGGVVSGDTGIFNTAVNGTSLIDGNIVCNIRGGEIKNFIWGVAVMGKGYDSNGTIDNNKSVLNIYDGAKIVSDVDGCQGICTNASNGRYAGFTINIYGGEVNTSKGTGMYLPGMGETNISGGTITGVQGIRIASGDLSISGGTVVGNTALSDNADLISGGNGGTEGAIVAGKASKGYVGDINISISGGAEIKNTADVNGDKPAIIVSDKNMGLTDEQSIKNYLEDEVGKTHYSNSHIEIVVEDATITGDVIKVSNRTLDKPTVDGGNTELTLVGTNVEGNVKNYTKDGNLNIESKSLIKGSVVNKSGGNVYILDTTVTGKVENSDAGGKIAILGTSDVKGGTTGNGIIDEEDIAEREAYNITTLTGYDTIEKAIEQADPGDTIKLQKNAEIDSMLDIAVEGITLDLGGNEITASEAFTSTFDNNSHVINIGANGVTIKNGTVTATAKNKHCINLQGVENAVIKEVKVDHTNASKGAPIVVNGSGVTFEGNTTLITGQNSWYAMNVDSQDDGKNGKVTIAEGAVVTLGEDGKGDISVESNQGNQSIENNGTLNGNIIIGETNNTQPTVSNSGTINGNVAAIGNVTNSGTIVGKVTSQTGEIVNSGKIDGEVSGTVDNTGTINHTHTYVNGVCSVCGAKKPSTGGGTVTPSVTKSRVAGANRFETAIKVADQLKKELGVVKFNNIVVAYSDEFADALSATALAADKDAPILVVNKNNESMVKKYISANLNKGGNVYIIGGTSVVSESFEKSLTGCKVTRLGGADRYETNLAVLKAIGVTGASDIMVASGLKYPDALSASATGNPVLLVGKTLTDNQKTYLKTLGGNDDYYIIGETAAVNATIMNQLNASKLGTVTRLGGDTRYETGLAVADEFFTNARNVVIASGDDFPDGLTGGVLANAMNAPLMLVNQYNTDVAADYVDDNSVRTVIAIGGTTVIPDATLNKVA